MQAVLWKLGPGTLYSALYAHSSSKEAPKTQAWHLSEQIGASSYATNYKLKEMTTEKKI